MFCLCPQLTLLQVGMTGATSWWSSVFIFEDFSFLIQHAGRSSCGVCFGRIHLFPVRAEKKTCRDMCEYTLQQGGRCTRIWIHTSDMTRHTRGLPKGTTASMQVDHAVIMDNLKSPPLGKVHSLLFSSSQHRTSNIDGYFKNVSLEINVWCVHPKQCVSKR